MDEIIFNSKSVNPEDLEGCNIPPRMSKSGESSGFKFKRKERKISSEKRAQLENVYAQVVVNDFGDFYHLSPDERAKRSRYYKIFSELKNYNRKCRKIDDFVRLYRKYMDVAKVVAAGNGIYDPQKFLRMVLKKKIKVVGLNFPEYSGKGKKQINWELVVDYITDTTKNPDDLVQTPSRYEDMSEEELDEALFSKGELEMIASNAADDSSDDLYVEDASVKQTRKFNKENPFVLKTVQDMYKSINRRTGFNNRLSSFMYDMTEDDFDKISSIDRSRYYESESDVPEFRGNVMKNKDVDKYIFDLNEYEKSEIRQNYYGKMKTEKEIEEIKLKDSLESAGWNVRKLYRNDEKIKAAKKAYKKDKKREERLKKELIKIQNRHKSRKEVEFNAKDKKKKKKKKDKESE